MNKFKTVLSSKIESLGANLYHFVHPASGAKHFHIEVEDDNNAFLVGFPTLPADSTGIAHILEHTALCGSKKYPVRDPFFMMLRRSLNTYMNAFTAPDATAYPFATRNKKDFYNLLSVYLDAVFNPNLNVLDFAQEGWRFELSIDKNNQPTLKYHGVVYNEMKGAMSSPNAQLWNYVHAGLFPDTTYSHNSGGDPKFIPDLTHEALCQFHKRYYNPSNAVFMTYGDLPYEEHQAFIIENSLTQDFQSVPRIEAPFQNAFRERVELNECYQAAETMDGTAQVVWAWVCGSSLNSLEVVELNFFATILLEHSASPLMYFLETTENANAPSDLCGVDDSAQQLVFICGLDGVKTGAISGIDAQLELFFERLAETGVAESILQASIDKLELEQRDWDSGSYPKGLSLMGRILGAAIYNGDPVSLLNIDPIIEKIRAQISDPLYFKSLVNKFINNNLHAARIVMNARTGPDPMVKKIEKELLKKAKSLSDSERSLIQEQAENLKERQSLKDDESVLPKVTLQDVPNGKDFLKPSSENTSFVEFEAPANGIFRIRAAFPLPELTDEELEYFPLFCDYLNQFGIDKESYLDTQNRRSRFGEFSVSSIVRPNISRDNQSEAYLLLSGKGLSRNTPQVMSILGEMLHKVRFDEAKRLQELLCQSKAEGEQSLTGKGHYLAMSLSACSFNTISALEELWSGGSALLKIKKLCDQHKDRKVIDLIFKFFISIRDKILTNSPKMMAFGEEESLKLASDFLPYDCTGGNLLDSNFISKVPNLANRNCWLIESQVNFCSLSFSAVSDCSPDAPILAVLGKYLQEGFLHRKIRESGGAYGSGANYFPDSQSFKFFSYRDPRLFETIADFKDSIQWVLSDKNKEQLEQATLGVIRGLDSSLSKIAEADRSFMASLYGKRDCDIAAFRQGVLGVSHIKLVEVAEKYLLKEGRIGLVASKGNDRSLIETRCKTDFL